MLRYVQTSGGYEVGRSSETEAAAGDGWDDADNWESFEVTTPQSSAKSKVCSRQLFALHYYFFLKFYPC